MKSRRLISAALALGSNLLLAGCLELGPFTSIQAGYDQDCARVALVWTEKTPGGALESTEVPCASLAGQAAPNPELVKACEAPVPLPPNCSSPDTAETDTASEIDGTGEVGQPDSDGDSGQETTEVTPDSGGPEAEVGPETDVPVVCNADCDLQDTVCQDFSCVGGTCVPENLTAECDDGEACTHTDVCVAGVCQGAAYDCTPEAACQESTCDGAGGCTEPVAKAGWCALDSMIGPVGCFEQGEQISFSGFVSCLTCMGDGTSTGGVGFASDGSSCSENCIENATCQSGVCTGDPAPDGTSCSGLNPCETPGLCSAGECEGQELVDCSDGDACTADVCGADGACSNPSTTPTGVKVGGFIEADIYLFGTAGSGSLGPTSVVQSGASSVALVTVEGPTLVGSIDAPVTLEPVGAKDLALVQLYAFGSAPKIRQLDGGTGGSIEVQRSAGSDGGTIVAGTAPSTTNFGTAQNPFTASGPESFVAGFNNDLLTVFVKRHTNPQPSIAVAHSDGSYSLALTSSGNVIWPSIAGELELPSGSGTTAFWLRLNEDGLATNGFQVASGVDPTLTVVAGTTTVSNAVTVVGGTYGNPIAVGPVDSLIDAPPVLGRDAFISKHWASGELAWVKWLTSAGEVSLEAIVPNGSGFTVLGTHYSPTGGVIDVGGNTFGSTTSYWTFVFAVDGNGELLWSAVIDALSTVSMDESHLLTGTKGSFVDLTMSLNGVSHAITAGEGDTFAVGISPLTGEPHVAYGLFTPTSQMELVSSDLSGFWASGPGFPIGLRKIGLVSEPVDLPSNIGGTFWWAMRLKSATCL